MGLCARCGTFLCGACTELMGDAAYCAGCVAWLHQHGPVSRAVQVLIGMNLVALVTLPLCLLVPVLNLVAGALGWWGAARELGRIHRGEGPLRGVRQARVARTLGMVNLLLVALWGAVFLYAWSRGAFG